MVPPGSFTKNFGWNSNFERLHHAIRQGFDSNSIATDRGIWRHRNSELGENLPLVALNFFLLNNRNLLIPDELVWMANSNPYSTRFDGLSFYALNLSAVGQPPITIPRPAPWAGDFIRNDVWRNGLWKTPGDVTSLIGEAVRRGVRSNSPRSLDKVRNNYRWMFQIAYQRRTLDVDDLWVVNSGFQEWLPNAIFLTWDRLAPSSATRIELLDILQLEEVHKLAGCPLFSVTSIAEECADRYIAAGRILRFSNTVTTDLSDLEPALTDEIGVVLQEATEPMPMAPQNYDGEADVVPRLSRTVNQSVRNAQIVRELKIAYLNRCAVCGLQLHVGGGNYYSEGAHIRPIGTPHNGPDVIQNMIPLCPNHHKQFDKGTISIAPDARVYQRLPNGDVVPGHPPMATICHPAATPIGRNFLKWHFELHMGYNDTQPA